MNEVRAGEGGGSSWNLFGEWLNLLPFPNLCWGRREQMDTGRRGRRVRNEGDGWGTDGVGGKRRGESARMVGKFSTWPWVEMKICIHHGTARFWDASFFLSVGLYASKSCGPSQQSNPSQGICRTRTEIFSRGQLLQTGICTVFKSHNGNGRGQMCANAVPKTGWDVVSLPRHPSQRRNWSLWFWRGILRPVC